MKNKSVFNISMLLFAAIVFIVGCDPSGGIARWQEASENVAEAEALAAECRAADYQGEACEEIQRRANEN